MRQNFSWKHFEILLIILCIALQLYVVFSPANSLMNWYKSDDAFYYYKIAANINEGRGITFDGVNITNGFQPLWMLICIPIFSLARYDLTLPLRALVFVSIIFSAGTGILLFRFMQKFLSPLTSSVVAVIWMFHLDIHEVVVQNGMETTISAFFIILLLYLVVHWRERTPSLRQIIIMGIVAGLTILSRLDNVFLVLLLGVWFVLGRKSGYLRNVVVGDLALIFVCGLLTYYIRLRAGPFYQEFSSSLPILTGIGFVLKPLLFYAFDLYVYPGNGNTLKRLALRGFLAVSIASMVTGIVLFALWYFNVIPDIKFSVLVIDWVGTLLGVTGLRLLLRIFFQGSSAVENGNLHSWDFWKEPFQRALQYYVPVGLILGSYLAWNYYYAGTFMPISGQIKHWWAGLRNTIYGATADTLGQLFGVSANFNAWKLAFSPFSFLAGLYGRFLPENIGPVISIFGIITLAVLIIYIFISQRKWLAGLEDIGLFAVFLSLYSHIFYYTSTSYLHVRSWYWVGEMFLTIMILGIFLECIRLNLEHRQWGVQAWKIFMPLLSLVVLTSFSTTLWRMIPWKISAGNQDDYLVEVHFLESQTEPGALIGTTGGGVVAYFITDRTIVNLDGLVNSLEYFRLLKQGQGAVFLDRLGLDYVYDNPYVVTETDPYHDLLDGHLERLARLDRRLLYRYVASGK